LLAAGCWLLATLPANPTPLVGMRQSASISTKVILAGEGDFTNVKRRTRAREMNCDVSIQPPTDDQTQAKRRQDTGYRI